MEAFLVSLGVVALAEIGDRTQLLSIVLAARYRRPWPIIAGILVATLVNHALAGAVGAAVMRMVGPTVLRWLLALSFFSMAVWILVPDKLDEASAKPRSRAGVFGTTVVTFFLAEMGDKTQIATAALAARYASLSSLAAVIAGTTLGMMLANVPAVLLAHRYAGRAPTRLVRSLAALIFVVLGILVLVRPASSLLP